MIRMLTAYTLEVDDAQYALAEILGQLDLEHNLLKNTAGMMVCHSDFVGTGVASEIAEKLPFDVVGGTSLATMTAGEDDSLMLSVSVLTSDDIEFSAFSAGRLDQPGSIAEAYRAVKKEKTPALVIPFIPLLVSVAHEQIMLDLDAVVDDAPVFGTVVADHTADYSTCHVRCERQVYQLHTLLPPEGRPLGLWPHQWTPFQGGVCGLCLRELGGQGG